MWDLLLWKKSNINRNDLDMCILVINSIRLWYFSFQARAKLLQAEINKVKAKAVHINSYSFLGLTNFTHAIRLFLKKIMLAQIRTLCSLGVIVVYQSDRDFLGISVCTY